MQKAELMALAEKYNMDFLVTDAVTKEKCGVYVATPDSIPELDTLVDQFQTQPHLGQVVPKRTYFFNEVRYCFYAPPDWFDKWGWQEPTKAEAKDGFTDRLNDATVKAQDRNAGHAAPDPQRTDPAR